MTDMVKVKLPLYSEDTVCPADTLYVPKCFMET